MRTAFAIGVGLLFLVFPESLLGQAPPQGAGDWPRFRGADGSGVSTAADVPVKWSGTKNVLWKAELPGRGASSPILWRDRVYVTAYSGYGLVKTDSPANKDKLRRHLLCFARGDGTLTWQAEVGGPFREHDVYDFNVLHGYASSTPAADESGVYCYFGNAGVVAYGHDGKERWRAHLGDRMHSWGSASSPILFGDLLIVHADIEARAMVALDKNTGKVAWKTPTGDPKNGDSWSTPLIVDVGGKPELVHHRGQGDDGGTVPAILAALDPRTGESLWEARGLRNYLCPSPVAHGGVVYAIAYQHAFAVRAGGRGDVSASHINWAIKKGSEVCSPVYHDGHLYWTSEDGGHAYCVNAATGAVVYQERLGPDVGRVYASAVLAGGRIYYQSRQKGLYVVAAKPKFELVAHNVIDTDDSVFNASPAPANGRLYLRSDRFLYCVGK